MSQRGATKLSVIIATALGLGFIASAYLNYAQFQRAQQDKSLLNGEISDLKYQVDLDHKSGSSPSPSPSPSDSPSPTATPTPTPAVAGASTATVVKAGNIHSAPSKSSSILIPYTSVHVGTSVTKTGTSSGGYTGITINGTTGYIESGDLQ